jgi:predicted 3-demethylubiquinone-9 3-methyltransferase (glyoxalase superfamily)
MDKLSTCLWFDGQAAEAAAFYTSLIPNSRVLGVNRSPADTPSGEKGSVLTIDFELDGHRYIGLNGGPEFKFTEAISLSIDCDDQAEVDHYWDALIANGGEPSVCGWLKDRFGLSWQVVPRRMTEMFASPDRPAAERAMKAMLQMRKLEIDQLERAFAGETAAAGAR